METSLIHQRLEHLESDLYAVRALVKKSAAKRIVSLKGMFKGITVTDDDVREAKRSVFKHVHP